MATKIHSLHIGVAYTDLNHYGDSLIPLPCCVTDAKYMHSLGKLFNYDKTRILLNEEATVRNVKEAIKVYSRELDEGDLCVITYSGHGSAIPDFNGDEPSGEDQTWCLYDRQLIDDELPHLWKLFKAGVNVLVVLDACHSGSAVKNKGIHKGIAYDAEKLPADYMPKVKSISRNGYVKIFNQNKDLYAPLLQMKEVEESEVECSVLLLSACQDEEQALAGSFISFYTRLLVNELAKEGDEIKNYVKLHEGVEKISKEQEGITPNLFEYGRRTDFFKNTKPFLRPGESFPKGISSLYADLLLGSNSIIDKGLADNGLLVDLIEGTKNKLEELSDSTDVNLVFKSKKGETEIEKPTSVYLVGNDVQRKSLTHPWDRAYEYYDRLKAEDISAYVEPDMIFEGISDTKVKASDNQGHGYLKNWPNPVGYPNEFGWHLDEKFTELAAARDWVINNIPPGKRTIKIAHIDTGFVREHPALPENLDEGYSFVKGEGGGPAIDVINTNKIGEQDYHGTATSILLAGKEVGEDLAFADGHRKIGAIPFAEVYPMRISDTVALVFLLKNTTPFVKAVRKAIDLGCEVITMSMGGIPVRAWAKAVNEAYNAGVTVVTAAGNSFKGLAAVAPQKLLYPARFDRVVAVSGVCFNQEPYLFKVNSHPKLGAFKGGDNQQGNHLPMSAMKMAIAAYTPNIPWAQIRDGKPVFRKTGGGTSAATPQVAAAAALWLVKNRDILENKGYAGTWKQVEAVRYALFEGADKTAPMYKRYYGNGTLKAKRTLNIPVPEENKLKKSRKAKVSPFRLLPFVRMMILRKSSELQKESFDEIKGDMILQEIVQILERDSTLANQYQELDLFEEEETLSKEQFLNLFKSVQASAYASEYIKSLPIL